MPVESHTIEQLKRLKSRAFTIVQFRPKQKFHVVNPETGKCFCMQMRNRELHTVVQDIEEEDILYGPQFEQTCTSCLEFILYEQDQREHKAFEEYIQRCGQASVTIVPENMETYYACKREEIDRLVHAYLQHKQNSNGVFVYTDDETDNYFGRSSKKFLKDYLKDS